MSLQNVFAMFGATALVGIILNVILNPEKDSKQKSE